MFLALTKFVAAVHGSDVVMLNAILEGCHAALAAREGGLVTDRDGESLLMDMLHKPLEVGVKGWRGRVTEVGARAMRSGLWQRGCSEQARLWPLQPLTTSTPPLFPTGL